MSTYWIRYRGTRFPIRRGETVIGRSPYCTIVVSNSLVSREHCILNLGVDGLVVTDLGSTNGTKVNGDRFTGSRKLDAGDIVGVGSDMLEVLLVEDSRQRGADSTRRQAVDMAKQEPEDASTASYRGTLDLVEALATSATESGTPMMAFESVSRALEDIVRAYEVRGEKPSRSYTTRICAIAERVASWVDDGSLDAWRDEILARASEAH